MRHFDDKTATAALACAPALGLPDNAAAHAAIYLTQTLYLFFLRGRRPALNASAHSEGLLAIGCREAHREGLAAQRTCARQLLPAGPQRRCGLPWSV